MHRRSTENPTQDDPALQNLETFYYYFPVKYQQPKYIVTIKSKSFWVTMEKAPPELQWKVGSHSPHPTQV
jgi:hypothetical protein